MANIPICSSSFPILTNVPKHGHKYKPQGIINVSGAASQLLWVVIKLGLCHGKCPRRLAAVIRCIKT